MATIRARKRTDGSISYTAQVRLFCDGLQVYQESQTFARKQTAWQLWVDCGTLQQAAIGQMQPLEQHNLSAVLQRQTVTYVPLPTLI